MSENKMLTPKEMAEMAGEIAEMVDKATDDAQQGMCILDTAAGLLYRARLIGERFD